jgi:hypothetical protein
VYRLFLSGDHGHNNTLCGQRESYNIHPISICNMLPLEQLVDCADVTITGMKRDD